MIRQLALVLVLALAAPARAADPVELEPGQPAPFKGSLCDITCAAEIAAKRTAAQEEARRLGLELQSAQAAQGQAEQRAAAAEDRPSWGVVLGVGGGALAAGLIAGLVLGLTRK